MSGPALTSLTAIPTVAEGDTARSNAKPMYLIPAEVPPATLMSHAVSLCPPQIIIHRHHSTRRLISRLCPEDSGVPLFYTPQTSPLGATKCITQRDYQIRHCLIVLRFVKAKNMPPYVFTVADSYLQFHCNINKQISICSPGLTCVARAILLPFS